MRGVLPKASVALTGPAIGHGITASGDWRVQQKEAERDVLLGQRGGSHALPQRSREAREISVLGSGDATMLHGRTRLNDA